MLVMNYLTIFFSLIWYKVRYYPHARTKEAGFFMHNTFTFSTSLPTQKCK